MKLDSVDIQAQYSSSPLFIRDALWKEKSKERSIDFEVPFGSLL